MANIQELEQPLPTPPNTPPKEVELDPDLEYDEDGNEIIFEDPQMGGIMNIEDLKKHQEELRANG